MNFGTCVLSSSNSHELNLSWVWVELLQFSRSFLAKRLRKQSQIEICINKRDGLAFCSEPLKTGKWDYKEPFFFYLPIWELYFHLWVVGMQVSLRSSHGSSTAKSFCTTQNSTNEMLLLQTCRVKRAERENCLTLLFTSCWLCPSTLHKKQTTWPCVCRHCNPF